MSALRTLKSGYRCTCHHPGRHCRFQCGGSAEVARQSDGRPVCSYCVRCDPATSAGFRVDDYYWEQVPA